MPKRVVLVVHESDMQEDRVSTWLSTHGYDCDWRTPCLGQSLEPPGPDVAGAVLYGGDQYVNDRLPCLVDEARYAERCMRAEIPLIGLCLGGQIIADVLGARVEAGMDGLCEFGHYRLNVTPEGHALFPRDMYVTQAHFHGFEIPRGAIHLAGTDLFPNQAFSHGDRTFGFQFHPELTGAEFARWQNDDWASAYWGKPGAQTRAEQDEIGKFCLPVQEAWMDRFLTGLFGPVAG